MPARLTLLSKKVITLFINLSSNILILEFTSKSGTVVKLMLLMNPEMDILGKSLLIFDKIITIFY